jgi:predicted O-linked N-acetylglucosamine transferase (SPINDLY family)
MRNRAEKSFDHFIDVSNFTDRAIALIARYFEIDIAIDLKGYTAHSRPGIFAYRAAPVQINYLGFPGTMGANFIDYIVADPIIIPNSYEKFYSEKILRLPMSYQVNDQTRASIERSFTRSDVGLPQDKFVFSSFNTNYKILPDTLTSWARILNAVPNSVMWILADNETAKKNLTNEFVSRGIDGNRIIFAERADPKMNLARQDCADLFLDAFPCTAHTTASDAVFSGVPLLTMIGETFASRVAASVLSAVGLPDLITSTRKEYEEKAIYFGNNPHEAKNISAYLKKTIRLTPLFDTAKTARDLENLYIEALEKMKQ